MQGVCMSKVIFRTTLRGFIEHSTNNGVTCTIVNKIYHNGKLVTGQVNSDTLKDSTLLISATGFNGDIAQFAVWKVSLDDDILRLEEISLHCKEISDDLLSNICEVYNLCHTYNNVGDEYTIIRD
jgi:hypothetical protein